MSPASIFLHRVCLVGSGNWASAIATVIGKNVLQFPSIFAPKVKMWVHEEMIGNERLTDFINKHHENPIYLPKIKIPENVIATPSLAEAATDATLLVLCVPHQFVRNVCDEIKGHMHGDAKAISLIKGIDASKGLSLISDVIAERLNIDVSVLMGANIASEVAGGHLSEATIGCKSKSTGELWRRLFHTPNFRVSCVQDVYGVELCGALKNICAVGAGIVDGLQLGANTKSAIMRIGLLEMRKFAKMFYPDVQDDTFLESCGVADVIATCIGGRNRMVAEQFVKTGKSFETLERELLNGQKLQGTLTAEEVHTVLKSKGLTQEFPFFSTVYRIAYEGANPKSLIEDI